MFSRVHYRGLPPRIVAVIKRSGRNRQFLGCLILPCSGILGPAELVRGPLGSSGTMDLSWGWRGGVSICQDDVRLHKQLAIVQYVTLSRLLPTLSHLQILHLHSEMVPEDPNPNADSDLHQAPTMALKQALCFSCWDKPSNLSRCGACKRVSYCSKKCQKQDWNRNHKKICNKLVSLNKRKGYMPSAGRHWNDYYKEQVGYFAR